MVIANAMHPQVAKAIAAFASLPAMSKSSAPDQPQRRARLAALLAHAEFGGVRAELARFLGLKSGAYIRQLLEGERPVTEKLVERIEAANGGKFKGWFSDLAPALYSERALRVAAIYDQVSAKDRRHIDAVADAAASPDSSDDMPDAVSQAGAPPPHAPRSLRARSS